jgi:aconitate hydratase
MTIFEAAQKYRQQDTPLLVIAGKEYGTGSSRDWAAKGTILLGVKAAIAESFERIHRSNLVGMGVWPLEFRAGENRTTLSITGDEIFEFPDVAATLKPRQEIQIRVTDPKSGTSRTLNLISRIDTEVELNYYRNGGILPFVLRRLAGRG